MTKKKNNFVDQKKFIFLLFIQLGTNKHKNHVFFEQPNLFFILFFNLKIKKKIFEPKMNPKI